MILGQGSEEHSEKSEIVVYHAFFILYILLDCVAKLRLDILVHHVVLFMETEGCFCIFICQESLLSSPTDSAITRLF